MELKPEVVVHFCMIAGVNFDMDRLERVERLMQDFADRTGLDGADAPQRYLWTDAFAVCNYLSLERARGDGSFLDRARAPTRGGLHGWVTAQALIASDHGDDAERRELAGPAEFYRKMFAGRDQATGDALGIGGLLVDAWQLFRILPEVEDVSRDAIAELVDAGAVGLEAVIGQRQLEAPPAHRLAFRELGNDEMLATCLAPVGYLGPAPGSESRKEVAS